MQEYYFGKIVDVKDPEKRGRARVMVRGMYDDMKTEDLPWAVPKAKSAMFGGNGGGSISIPRNGIEVRVSYPDPDDIYSPEFEEPIELNDDLRKELNLDGEYEGTHFFALDPENKFKIFYTVKKGFTITLNDSRINILNNGMITIEHRESKSIIELEGPNIRITSDSTISVTAQSEVTVTTDTCNVDANRVNLGHGEKHPSVLGDELFDLLSKLAKVIDAKMPSAPGVAASIVESFESTVLSSTVQISD